MKAGRWILGAIGLFVVVLIIAQFTGNAAAGPTAYDDFAQCLEESGTKMYGAYWCPHCEDQKDLFDNSQYIPYIECDPRGDDADPTACEAAGVQGYPTWVFPNGERASGARPLSELAFRSGCELPQE